VRINPTDTVSVPAAAVDGLPAHTAAALRFCSAWTLLEAAWLEQDRLSMPLGPVELKAACDRISNLRSRAQEAADVAYGLFAAEVSRRAVKP
jgi:hypothetical protein